MSTIEAEAPQSTPTPESQAVAELTRSELFAWHAWVHVGEGVEDCELTKAVSETDFHIGQSVPVCNDSRHFHAWCRLPNQFQRRDIMEKAKAARARKMRELRDPDSDAAVVMEDELAQLDPQNDREQIIAEIIERDYTADMARAVTEVLELEGDEEPDEETGEVTKLYDHIDQDFEELDRLKALPEDQRDENELKLVQSHIDAYNAAVGERMEDIQRIKREALSDRPWESILDTVRKDRQGYIASEVQLATYMLWQMYVCTLKPVRSGIPAERMWKDISAFRMDTAPEVVDALRATFERLGSSWARSQRGKA